MISVKEQFSRCKLIFMQNIVIVPVLLVLIASIAMGGYHFGKKFQEYDNKFQSIENNTQILMDVKRGVDSLNIYLRSK